MILAIDIGNTNIVIGCMKEGKVCRKERLSTDLSRTDAEYAILFQSVLSFFPVTADEIEGSICSSVVPPLSETIKKAVNRILPDKPFFLTDSKKDNGLAIAIDAPEELGADLISAACGALCRYEAPMILIDMGTATTLSAIDSAGVFRGVVIAPGLAVSVHSLVSGTASLPDIDLTAPPHVIGTNTADSMKSGAIYGSAAMLDGLIAQMEEEMGSSATLLATGGLAGCVVPHCRHQILIDDDLILTGLAALYERNQNA